MGTLCGKVAIITGAAQGIGKAVATKYVKEGANVAIVDLNIEKATATAAELEKEYGTKCIAYKADVTSFEDAEATVKAVLNDFGKIDVLINNAGVQPPKQDFWDIEPKTWDFCLNVNLKSVFLFSKAVAPYFIEKRDGVIINTSSVAGPYLWQGSAHYIVTKAGIRDLTKAMAYELAEFNVRVNCVAPGHVDTAINAELLKDPGAREKTNGQVPLGRMALPEDLAGAFAFLAKDESSYITGTCMYVDGGLSQNK